MKEVIKINENTWRIEDGMVRFYLLCGNEKAALIDTGMNCPDAKHTAQELTDLPLILINTHADPDHISGNGAFGEFYMSPNEEENLHAHKDLIPKLIQGAQAILDGNAQKYAQPVNVFGNDVTLYKFDYAGFLYQK